MTDDKTITMNGKDYEVDQISDKAKYLVSQLKDLRRQAEQTRARLDQIEVCSTGFTQLLEHELKQSDD